MHRQLEPLGRGRHEGVGMTRPAAVRRVKFLVEIRGQTIVVRGHHLLLTRVLNVVQQRVRRRDQRGRRPNGDEQRTQRKSQKTI